jgi:serine phosphatase RsbU (regulator of sigma subunit)
MEKLESHSFLDLNESFIDVLYITSRGQMPLEIKRLLEQKKVSCHVLPINRFHEVRDRFDLIGTVIIDMEGTNCSEQLVQIIESLETKHIGVILLSDKDKLPVESSSMSPSTISLPKSETSEVSSLDELWVRISANLKHREKSSTPAAKPATSSRRIQTTYKNKLAEQIDTARTLIENLAEQLRLAGLVQKDFLPTKLPQTDRIRWATIFLPAEWVSGDIFDIVRVDEEHIGFYLADVVGHGMPAALLTIFLKQALVMRQTVENNYRVFSPSEVVRNLNIRMAAQKLSGYQFATCCYCLLNIKTLELTFARAGHPYPILIRAGKPLEQLEIRGSLLGVFEQTEFPQRTIQLKPGDKLLLYSDGADSLIGNFNNRLGFCFTKEFQEIKHMPITQLLDVFGSHIRNQEVEQIEIDDITMVGLEILK